MKVVIVEPGKQPYTANINNEIEEFQAIVDGYVESIRLSKDLILICNEDGKSKKLEPNRDIGGVVIVGTFLVVGNDAPDFRSLTDEECSKIHERFLLMSKDVESCM